MNDKVFIGNILMVAVLLVTAIPQFIISFIAIPRVELVASPYDYFLYIAWTFILVETIYFGALSIKFKYESDFEEWLSRNIPPLFPETIGYSV